MDEEMAAVEAMLKAEFPHWHPWRGVTGVLYARRPRSSPPKVVRAADVPALRAAIVAKETRQD